MAVTTLEQIIKNKVLGDANIMSKLAAGADSYFPRAGVEPGSETPTPFLVTVLGSRRGTFPVFTSWTFFIYDSPEERYWRVEGIVRALYEHFNELRFPPTAPGYEYYLQVSYDGVSEQTVDTDWNLNLMTMNFSSDGIA